MPHLEFGQVHYYPSAAIGIAVPVVLKSGAEVIDLLAYLDTGATTCLFERKHGELLNLEIEAGDHRTFRTATGSVEAFGHVVELQLSASRLSQ